MAGGSYVWLSNDERKKNVRGAHGGARKRGVVRVSMRSRDLIGFVLAGDGCVGLGVVRGVWVRCGCGVSSVVSVRPRWGTRLGVHVVCGVGPGWWTRSCD